MDHVIIRDLLFGGVKLVCLLSCHAYVTEAAELAHQPKERDRQLEDNELHACHALPSYAKIGFGMSEMAAAQDPF